MSQSVLLTFRTATAESAFVRAKGGLRSNAAIGHETGHDANGNRTHSRFLQGPTVNWVLGSPGMNSPKTKVKVPGYIYQVTNMASYL
jgi:hypothetical protein